MIQPRREIATFEPVRRQERPRIGAVQRLGHSERTVALPAEFVREAFARVKPEELTAIPELEPFYQKLISYLGVARDRVLACAGADAGIALLYQAYVRPGDEVVRMQPTYHRYAELAALYGAREVCIGYDAELRPELDAVRRAIGASTRLVVLVNPTSPTGARIEFADIEDLAARCARHDALLLVDEVYHHFCEVTAIPLVTPWANVVVARSFSKALGLAGIRVGAMVGSPSVIAQLWKLKPRHEIAAVSARIAECMLDHLHLVDEYVLASREGQRRLAIGLAELQFRVFPSQSASVMVRVPADVEPSELATRLWNDGYEIAAGFASPFNRFVRVSVGPPEQMDAFVETVRACL